MDDSSDEEDEQSNERKDSSNMQIIVNLFHHIKLIFYTQNVEKNSKMVE